MNEVIDEDRVDVIDNAIAKVRDALDGLYAQEQIAVLVQVTGYLLMLIEHRHGKETGDVARKNFSTGLRNVCSQWRKTFKQIKDPS